jgi:hypothetical protein
VSTTTVTDVITEAIEELQATFAGSTVSFESDGAGGAWVIVDSVPIGPAYEQDTSWIAFQITFPYPEADIYPLFVRPDLRRTDGAAHGAGFQAVTWGPRGEPGLQLSRRSNRLNPAIDTAATKVVKVLKWLNEQ